METDKITFTVGESEQQNVAFEVGNTQYITDTNYNILKNKPKINGVELVGNKTLEELGFTDIDLSGYLETKVFEEEMAKINDFKVLDGSTQAEPFKIWELEQGLYKIMPNNYYSAKRDSSYMTQENTDYLFLTSPITEQYRYFFLVRSGRLVGGYTRLGYSDSIIGELNLRSANNILFSNSAQTITGIKTFDTLPISSVEPTNDNHFANKKYVDNSIANASGGEVPIYYFDGDTTNEDNKTMFVNLYNKLQNKEPFYVMYDNYVYIGTTNSSSYIDFNFATLISNASPVSYGVDYKEYKFKTIRYKIDSGNISQYYDRAVYMLDGTTDILGKNNTAVFTPTGDYNPATKIYVDENILASSAGQIKVYNLVPEVDFVKDYKQQLTETGIAKVNEMIELHNQGYIILLMANELYNYTWAKNTLFKSTYTNDNNINFMNLYNPESVNAQSFYRNNEKTESVTSNSLYRYSITLGYTGKGENSYTHSQTLVQWQPSEMSLVSYDKDTKNWENKVFGALTVGNTKEYIPTEPYHPATKDYVDTQVGDISTILSTLTTVEEVSE